MDRGSRPLAALVLCAACNRAATTHGSGGLAPARTADAAPPVAAAEVAAPPAAPGTTPLLEPDSIIDVPLTGFLPSLATIPIGSSGRRPVAVAVHGLSDGPQWACPLWRGILGGGVFILCPRGVKEHDQPRDPTPNTTYYGFTTWQALDAEIEAGLAALRERYPGRLDEGPVLYIGFSIGARFGIDIALAHPGRYPRLLLSEGGHDGWTIATASRFARDGGARVLWSCGEAMCLEEANAKRALLETEGLRTKIVYGPGSGHEPYGPIFFETRKVIDWLFEGDQRWMNR